MGETREGREAGVASDGGVLVCHVYRDGNRCAYLTHAGDHPALGLDMNITTGGDWEEAQVLYELPPPMPPRENGLWEMQWPWRDANHRPADHAAACPTPDYCDCDFDDEEICCRFEGEPTWTLLAADATPRAVPSGSGAQG